MNKDRLIFSSRFAIACLLGLGTMCMYSQRTNLSVAILCMTNNTAIQLAREAAAATTVYNGNANSDANSSTLFDNANQPKKSWCNTNKSSSQSTIALPISQDGEFAWNSVTRGLVLGVFFWGYLVSQVPLGALAQRFGAKHVAGSFSALLAVCTLLVPVAARFHIGLLYAIRVMAGIASGAWFPCFFQLYSKWAPSTERGVLMGIGYSGIHLGNAITMLLTGVLCQSPMGWPLVFYFYGVAGLLFCVVWHFCVFENPNSHPRISANERQTVNEACNLNMTSTHRSQPVPIFKMLTSVPVWAYVIVNILFDWNSYFFLTSAPSYMKDVLNFDLKMNAGLSALPYIALWIGQTLAGFISDFLLRRRILSLGVVRKIMTSIGMFGPCLTMLGLTAVTCHVSFLAVVLLTAGMFLSSGCYMGAFINPVELTPQFAGVLFAASNSASAATGFFAPYVVGALTPNETYEEWRNVFFLGSAIYAVGGFVYLFFSETNIQPWSLTHNTTANNGPDNCIQVNDADESLINASQKPEPLDTLQCSHLSENTKQMPILPCTVKNNNLSESVVITQRQSGGISYKPQSLQDQIERL